MDFAADPTNVFTNMPPEDLAQVVSSVNVLGTLLLKALPEFPPEVLGSLTGDGIKPAAFRAHSHELMKAFPGVANGAQAAERLGSILAALDQVIALLAPLERVVLRLVNLRRVLAHLGNTVALDHYAGAQMGARLKQPDAMHVSQELAPHHARARRKKVDAGAVDAEFDDSDDEALDAA